MSEPGLDTAAGSAAAGLQAYRQPGRAAAYRRKYEGSWTRRWSQRRERAMLARALRTAGTTDWVLDCPCGAGRMTPTVAGAGRPLAADFARPMLLETRAALAAVPPLVQGSAFALPFGTGALDTAVCWRLIHHVPDPAARGRLLRELRRVARRAVVLSFSDRGCLRGWLRAASGKDRHGPQSLLTRRELAAEARAAGLEPVAFDRLAGAFSVVAVAVLRVPG